MRIELLVSREPPLLLVPLRPSPVAKRPPRSWLGLAAKAIVTLVLFGVVLSQISLAEVFEVTRNASLAPMLLSLVLLSATTILTAARWRLLTAGEGRITFPAAITWTYASAFVGQLLPSTIGQDAFRIYLARRAGYPLAESSSVVFIDRLCGMVGLGLVILAGLPHLAAIGGVAASKSMQWIAGTLIVLSAISVAIGRFARLPNGLPAWLEDWWRAVRVATTTLTSGRGLAAIICSILIQVMAALSVWVVAIGVHTPLSLTDGFATIPAAIVVSMIPLSINGWGLREGAMVVSLGFAGIAPSQALAISLIWGVLLAITSLPGAAVLFRSPERP